MKLKVALLQILPETDQTDNFVKAKRFAIEAKAHNADIILLPELWNIGYSSPEEYFGGIEKWKSSGLSQNDLLFTQYTELAREQCVSIVFPYLEKLEDDTFANSAALIDSSGNLVLNYRKVHTVDKAWEVMFQSGEDFPVVDLHIKDEDVKVGIMICYDREFPESSRLLMLGGAEIILTPNACGLDMNRLHQFQARGFENMLGVAMTNYPAPKNNGRSVAYDGMRVKEDLNYDPTIVIADDTEGIFYAEFDIEKLRKYRGNEIWGDAYRKPRLYKNLSENNPKYPFVREQAKR